MQADLGLLLKGAQKKALGTLKKLARASEPLFGSTEAASEAEGKFVAHSLLWA